MPQLPVRRSPSCPRCCPYNGKYFHAFAAKGHEDSCRRMAEWARKYHLLLVGGSVPESADGLLYNTGFVYDPDGNLLARHRKVHLFDVDLPGMRFHESHTFTPGSDVTVFDTDFGRMGVAICFDVRFPELFRAMARRGAEPTGNPRCAPEPSITRSFSSPPPPRATKGSPMSAGDIP